VTGTERTSAGPSEVEAARRLQARGGLPPRRSSRSYAGIVRANTLAHGEDESSVAREWTGYAAHANNFYERSTSAGEAIAAWAVGSALGVGAVLGVLRLRRV
jgi:hypothetical protein